MTSSMATKEYIKLIKRFPLVRIKDDNHLDEALKFIDELLVRKRKNDLTVEELEYFAVLSDMVKHYETEKIPIKSMSPVELLVYLMEENGIKQADLAHLFSSKSNLSEILSGRREISKENARRLGNHFKINPAAFLF